MKRKTASQIICENFKIPPQTIFQDYKCTYKSSVMFFGRIYVGDQHFLFIANMFGLVKKCTIDIQNISKIQYNSSSNSISVFENSKNGPEVIEYVFGSFKNNNAYKLMMALWKGQKLQSDILVQQVEEENEKFDASQKMDTSKHIDEGQVEVNFFNAQAVETEKQKIVEIILPCSVKQFYEFFLSDKAIVYSRKKHLESRNGRQINVTEWRSSEQLKSDVREISAIIKVNGVPFLKEAGMSQVWMLKQDEEENKISLNVVTQMSDVPYSAYFNCEQYISISMEGQKKCRMVVFCSIVFNKSTYMKNKILTKTFADMKQEYESWIKNVKDILEKMKKKQEGSSSDIQKAKANGIQYEKSQLVPQQKGSIKPIANLQKKIVGSSKTFKVITNAFGSKNNEEIQIGDKVDAIIRLVTLILLINTIWVISEIVF